MEQNTLSLVHIFGAQQHQQHSGDRIKLSDLRQHFFFHALRISFVEFISSSIATPWLTEILGTNPTIRPILHADGHSSLVFLLIICVVVFVWLLHSQMWVNDFGRNEGVCKKKSENNLHSGFWVWTIAGAFDWHGECDSKQLERIYVANAFSCHNWLKWQSRG